MKDTLHVADVPDPDSAQVPLKDPAPVAESDTVPEGVTPRPADDMSATVIVQADGLFVVTGLAHEIVIEVVRRVTVIVAGFVVEPGL